VVLKKGKSAQLSDGKAFSYIMNEIGNGSMGRAANTAIGGFTLIELLVCIVIVGALGAIALPSYLSQAAKTRGSEAKSMLGTINRSQQAYRLENGAFASDIANLDAKVNGKFYAFSVGSGNTSDATALAQNNQTGLKISSTAVNQSGDVFTQIMCESNTTQLANSSPSLPAAGATSCPPNYVDTQ
jgi:type IV pilus assembly protein PilA